MNESDLREPIIARLRGKGPATLQTLASELDASQWEVQSVLEQLLEEGSVRLLFGGLWDVHWIPTTKPNTKEQN